MTAQNENNLTVKIIQITVLLYNIHQTCLVWAEHFQDAPLFIIPLSSPKEEVHSPLQLVETLFSCD